MFASLGQNPVNTIAALLAQQFSLNQQQAHIVAEQMVQAIGEFLQQQANEGTLDVDQLMELLKPDANIRNHPLVNQLTKHLTHTLESLPLEPSVKETLSARSVEQLFQQLQKRNLGTLDRSTITWLLQVAKGKQALGNLFGSLGKWFH